MLNIPLNTDVECVDGPCGKSSTLIFDPRTQKVTYLVVRDKSPSPDLEQMVPIDQVVETTHDLIRLSCTRAKFAEMESFIETRYIKGQVYEPYGSSYGHSYGGSHLMPYATPTESSVMPVEVERIPMGQVKIHRGMQVIALDGPVGKVGELLVDPESGDVSHLVLMEGHLWGKKEIVLPVSSVQKVKQDSIQLSLDKSKVEGLPSIPIKHAWSEIQTADLDLLIWTFDEIGKAGQALEVLNRQAQASHLTIFNSAVLVKDQDGQTSLKEGSVSSGRFGTLFGAITGGLLGLIVGPGGAVLGAVAGAAAGRAASGRNETIFPDEKLTALAESMQPGTSTLVVLVEKTWFETTRQALGDFDGELFHQRLPNAIDGLLDNESTDL